MTAYYNEIDPYAAQWLRNLIAAGHIAHGDVDERSITDVASIDLARYTQCHFFAGIGGWSYALRLAGWADDRPAWTGSCPCQPFSVGKTTHGGAKGPSDERHLWPKFYNLIRECRPAIVFGEQVASAIQWGWWDQVAMDLEAEKYACAAAVLRTDAIGGVHERKRIYWMADARSEGWGGFAGAQCAGGVTPGLSLYGNPLADARKVLDGDYLNLLSGDGVSVSVERSAAKGYGNAIVPQVAAEFIKCAIA